MPADAGLRGRPALLWCVTALAVAACSPYTLRDVPSANADDRVRFLVLHFTSEDEATSLRLLTQRSDNPVSAHYLVAEPDASGRVRVFRLVPEVRRAWHAGRSYWDGETALNGTSIGIEIVNLSSCPAEVVSAVVPGGIERCRFERFPDAQIHAVAALARDILARHPDIPPWRVLGHGDIAPARKVDPGPLFPWHELHDAGVGAWYRTQTKQRYQTRFEREPPSLREVQQALAGWGFAVAPTGRADADTRLAVRALQLHFRPSRADGIVDTETAAILFALLERYRPERLPGGAGRRRQRATPEALRDSE